MFKSTAFLVLEAKMSQLDIEINACKFKTEAMILLGLWAIGCVSPSFGEVCHGIGGGMVVCPDSGDSRQNETDRAQRAETRRLQDQAKRLEECLRKADWPGQPGRAECQRLFGGE